MPEYKWGSPSEWLTEKIENLAKTRQAIELAGIAGQLCSLCGGDQIQDEFGSEMEEDGYFKKWLSRSEIESRLEEARMNLRSHENDEDYDVSELENEIDELETALENGDYLDAPEESSTAPQRMALLSDRELATVLAALRYWQDKTPEGQRMDIKPIHFDDTIPLSNEEIDDLCERINCS